MSVDPARYVWRKILRLYWKMYGIVDALYTRCYFRLCPVKKNKVVFDNFSGKKYADTPKYIAEEIHRQGLNWDMVWLINNNQIEVPEYLRKVNIWSNRAKRELATAKIVVNNTRNSLRMPKKNGQIFLQAWHGGLGYKLVEGDAESKLSPEYIRAAKRDGQECDAIISACGLQTEQFHRCFWLNKSTEILEVGQPQCDVLFNADQQAVERKVREILSIPKNKTIILYAPTFRDDGSTSAYALDYERILCAYERRFKQECVIVVRLHPNAQTLCTTIHYNDKVINGTNYSDIQELFIASDAVISDYSNVSFQFALLNKPAFLLALDYDEYLSMRGLLDVYDYCPFPKSKTNAELIDNIEHFDFVDYFEQLDKYKKQVWKPFDDGHAAERTVAWLKEKVNQS